MIIFDIKTGPLADEVGLPLFLKFDNEWVEMALDKAALNPLAGQVLAIGYWDTDGGGLLSRDEVTLDIDFEREMISRFWEKYRLCRDNGVLLVGHNIAHFDVPFLLRRSWLLGLETPRTVIDRGRYIESRTFTDMMDLWSCGTYKFVSLDALAQAMGIGGKPEGVDGGMFAKLLETDRAAAEKYLRNDLETALKIAERMGLV